MAHKIIFFLVAVVFAAGTGMLAAGEHPEHSTLHKMVIALATDDFELAQTDISHLEIGDAETIYTDSGKTIDLLRTADGVEIYVDGELLETGLHGEEGIHGDHHVIHEHFEHGCDDDEGCEEMTWELEHENFDADSLHGADHHGTVIVIREEAEIY
jgi:hypothetical protein